MYFINKEHENFYNEKTGQANIIDSYRKSLIYLLSSNKETRQNFNDIYNLQKDEINIESLSKPWQTGTSLNTCRLAFNLYGDIVSDKPEEKANRMYTISELIKTLNIDIVITAIKLRFAKEKN